MAYVHEGSVMGVGILFLILGTASLVARGVVRVKTASLAKDDWFCLLAWVLVTVECCIMIAGAATHTVGAHSPPGLGEDILTYDGWDQLLLERLEYSFNIIQILALATLKLSVLFYYRRHYVGCSFSFVSTILVAIVCVWAVTFCVCLLAQCGSNIGANFETLGDIKTKCVDTVAILIALAASDVAVDLVILGIPVPIILALRVSLKKRIGMLAVLLVGMVAIACSIARMSLYIEILSPGLGGIPSDDYIGITSMLMFWGMLEMGIALFAICLPVTYRLLSPWTLLSTLRSLRTFHSLYSKQGSGVELTDTSGTTQVQGVTTLTRPCTGKEEVWTAPAHARGGYEAYVGPTSSGDRLCLFQKGCMQNGEIWEHTRIEQTSEVV